MAYWYSFFFCVIGVVILPQLSNGANPFEVMNNVMRRMRTEFEHAPTGAQMNRQLQKFKQHVNHIVRVNLVIRRGNLPPPTIRANLEALMKAQITEMEKHMHALMSSVGATFGHQKVHLLVKKVREHCNRHIVNRRKKIMERLREKPKKKFLAFPGYWKGSEVKVECRKRGGHLAMIASKMDSVRASDAIKGRNRNRNFYVNTIHSHGRHRMWQMPSLRPSFQRPKFSRCAMWNGTHERIKEVSCETRQGALCEFLSFNPYLKHAGKRVFFSLNSRRSFSGSSRLCKLRGGRIATIQNEHDRKSVQRMSTKVPAFISVASHYLKSNSQFCKFGNPSKSAEKKFRFAIKDEKCIRVKRDERLKALCEIRVVADKMALAERSTAIGTVFVAFNKKSDLYNKKEAVAKCSSIGGQVARIRTNIQQLAAVEALHHGLPVRLDELYGRIDSWYRWSDGTRLPRNQEWRIGVMNMGQGVSLDKYGVWRPAIGKMGVLCQVIRESGEEDNALGFKTEIRMDVDFKLVTATSANENAFSRALEAEVKRRCSVNGKGIQSAIVMSLRPGSTIAKIRVWTHSAGRAEANALQDSLHSGKFSITFMGHKVTPTPHQILSVDFDVTICIFHIPIPNKLLYWILPGAVAVLVLTLIIAVASILRRKNKRKARVNSVFTVDKEKELLAKEEKGPLPIGDAPPPYPACEDPLPDYDSCLDSKHVKI